jgi:hypothetical protein
MLVARATASLRSIFRLEPPEGIAAAESLTRSLAELVITFAWVAADPAKRIGPYESDLFRERLRVHQRIERLKNLFHNDLSRRQQRIEQAKSRKAVCISG